MTGHLSCGLAQERVSDFERRAATRPTFPKSVRPSQLRTARFGLKVLARRLAA
jgi:hypothetical protein